GGEAGVAVLEQGDEKALAVEVGRYGLGVHRADVINLEEIVVGGLPVATHVEGDDALDHHPVEGKVAQLPLRGGEIIRKGHGVAVEVEIDHAPHQFAADGDQPPLVLVETGE